MEAELGQILEEFVDLFDVFQKQSTYKQISTLVITCILFLSVCTIGVCLYRIRLHPLARFPGPRKAAISRAWLFKQNQSVFPERKFEDIHEYYSKVLMIPRSSLCPFSLIMTTEMKALRIGPNELHLTDVSLYKEIYNQTTPYLKHVPFYDSFLTAHTVFAECDPQLHKQRRKILNPFFSRAGVTKLEPIIKEKIELFLQKLKKISSYGPIDVSYAFRLGSPEHNSLDPY